MPNATIQFTRADAYILVPTGRLQLALLAVPPAGAELDIAVYAAPLGQDSGFRQVARTRIGDPGDGDGAAAQYAMPIASGLGYAFRLTGDAHLLLPGQHAMTVGLRLDDGAGQLIHDFGNQVVEATHALLDGLFYVKAG